MIFCPSCGKELPDGAKFCTGCGTVMNGGSTASTQMGAGIKKKLDIGFLKVLVPAVIVLCLVVGVVKFFATGGFSVEGDCKRALLAFTQDIKNLDADNFLEYADKYVDWNAYDKETGEIGEGQKYRGYFTEAYYDVMSDTQRNAGQYGIRIISKATELDNALVNALDFQVKSVEKLTNTSCVAKCSIKLPTYKICDDKKIQELARKVISTVGINAYAINNGDFDVNSLNSLFSESKIKEMQDLMNKLLVQINRAKGEYKQEVSFEIMLNKVDNQWKWNFSERSAQLTISSITNMATWFKDWQLNGQTSAMKLILG